MSKAFDRFEAAIQGLYRGDGVRYDGKMMEVKDLIPLGLLAVAETLGEIRNTMNAEEQRLGAALLALENAGADKIVLHCNDQQITVAAGPEDYVVGSGVPDAGNPTPAGLALAAERCLRQWAPPRVEEPEEESAEETDEEKMSRKSRLLTEKYGIYAQYIWQSSGSKFGVEFRLVGDALHAMTHMKRPRLSVMVDLENAACSAFYRLLEMKGLRFTETNQRREEIILAGAAVLASIYDHIKKTGDFPREL